MGQVKDPIDRRFGPFSSIGCYRPGHDGIMAKSPELGDNRLALTASAKPGPGGAVGHPSSGRAALHGPATTRDGDGCGPDEAEVAMGGMMGSAMGAWIFLWIFLGLVLAITGGVLAARALGTRRGTTRPQVRATESAAVQEAKDVLRRRYANGDISREDYLQGKVELED
jgi:uncharacterized membrane protein